MMILENNNGKNYEVIALSGYNKADRDYYSHKNTMIGYYLSAYGLLKQVNESLYDLYVVASAVTKSDWGNGYYFDNIEDAREYYFEKVEQYYRE